MSWCIKCDRERPLYCQSCSASELAQDKAEIERLQIELYRCSDHAKDCARTPFMREVMGDRDRLAAQNAKLREALEVYERNHPHTVLSCPCEILWREALQNDSRVAPDGEEKK